jgi:hypothetical protein
MIKCQSQNVERAIIDKGPFQLHPSLNNFILPAEEWLSMEVNEKESYIKRVMSSSVKDTVLEDYQRLLVSQTNLFQKVFQQNLSQTIFQLNLSQMTKYIFYLLLMFWQMLHYLIQSKILQGHVCQICQ